MEYRGSEGSRMPADWRSQQPGRPRSHSARAALDPQAGGSQAPGGDAASEDDAGYGTGEQAAQWHDNTSPGYRDEQWQGTGAWYQDDGTGYRDGDWYGNVSGNDEAAGGLADLARGARGAAPGGPARGFPPSPGQPGPVYPPDDSGAWSEDAGPLAAPSAGAPDQTTHWDGMSGIGQWDQTGTGQWDAATGQWDQTAGTGHWHEANGAPQWDEATGQWEASDDTRWDQPVVTGEQDAVTRTGEWEAATQTRQWDAATGQWDAATGQWDQAAGSAGPDQAADWEPAGYPGRYDDAYADEPDTGEDPSAPDSRARRSKRGRRTIILAAAGAVIVAALGTTAYTFLAGHSSPANGAPISVPKLPASQPTTAGGAAGTSKLGKWGHIASRATDKAPLTLTELYPAQFMINGGSYVRTVDRSDRNCANALFGSQLQTAATGNGCSEVLRASYMSSDEKMMGTIGVVNLATSAGAAKVGQATGSNDFVTPLVSSTGPTRDLNQGTGVVQAEYKGHYLILIWAEFANLKAPPTHHARVQLEQFSSGLISGSANIALSNRMVNGHP